jgi:uncharacterized protein
MFFYYFIFFSAFFIWFYAAYSFFQTYKEYRTKILYKVFFSLLNFTFFICLFFNPRAWSSLFKISLPEFFGSFYYLSFSILSLLMVSLVVKDLFTLFFLRPYEKMKKEKIPHPRRLFLKRSFSLFALTNTTALPALGYVSAGQPLMRDVFIHDPLFPQDFGEIRALQISDLHVGPIIKKEYVEKVREMILLKKPHFIFYTGDMVDGDVSELSSHFEPLKDLRGTLGNFFVTGNHEYYSGVTQWLDFFKAEMGCEVLMNENRILTINGKKLLIGGVNDYAATRFNKNHFSDPAKARGKEEVDYAICLAHQPKSVFKVKDAGFNFMCCGHTHGGQYIPFNLLVALVQPYVRGLYNHKGMPLYVNPGTGHWGPPNRFGIPAEVSHLIFNHQSSS